MTEIKVYPLVSIFAVCHKHASYLKETLDSIRKQTYPNVELIIINNLKDECEKIINDWIEKYEINCLFIQNDEVKTVTQNCNIGLAHSKGKYFQLISCDDVLFPQKIEKQVDLFETLDEKYGCVYSDVNYMDENGLINTKETLQEKKQKKWGTALFPSGNLKYELSLLSFIPAPAALHKTEIVKKLNGFDERYLFEDWPMWLKLCKNNYYFKGVDEPLVKYRLLSSSLGTDSKNKPYFRSLIQFYSDNFDFFNFRNKYTFLNFLSALSNSDFKLNNLLLAIKALLKSRNVIYTKYLLRYMFK